MLENQLSECLSLNGDWEIEIAGQRGTVQVPGAWEVQGYPDVEGPAIYRRHVDIPASWQGAAIMLRFGAVSYFAEVSVNGTPVGTHEGLWTPFEFDVSAALRYGEQNTVELTITKPADEGNRFPYREVLVGFVPYVSTTFGGIWQDAELVAHRAAFEAVHITPVPDSGIVTVQARIGLLGVASESVTVTAEIRDAGGNIAASASRSVSDKALEASLQVENPERWSPNNPALYTLVLRLEANGQTLAQTERRFGFRTLHTAGERLFLNGEPTFVRGVLSWGWNPRTLAPSFTDDEIRAEFRRLRELGFNLYKLCLYIPPPRLFEIADEEGMLLWLELPMWLPRLSDHLRQQAVTEYRDILARVHHHVSVAIYSLGCELSAEMADAALLEQLDSLARGATSGALVCDNSGSGEAYGGLSRDFADFNDYHFYCDLHYFTPLCDHFRRDWRPARPWIFGEFCDCDDYRDPTGLLQAGQRPQWRDWLGKDGGIHRWAYRDQESLIASLKLPFSGQQLEEISRQTSFVVRKTILETVRKRRDIGGYVVTGLRDTPISTSGMFNDAGHFKYDDDLFHQFNDDTVLLLEQGRARKWTNGGDRPAPHDLYNHEAGTVASFRIILATAQHPIPAGELSWSLCMAGAAPIAGGSLKVTGLSPRQSPSELASIEVQMPEVGEAAQFTLRVWLTAGALEIANEWPLWVYPQTKLDGIQVYDPVGVFGADLPKTMALSALASADQDNPLVVTRISPEVLSFVRAGGNAVLLVQPDDKTLPIKPVPFWRESIKLLYDHPAMNRFPHQGYADLQFYHLATDFALDSHQFAEQIGATVKPLFKRLDARLFTALDYLAEFELGSGRLIVSTLRFAGGTGDQVGELGASSAARFLLAQFAAYFGSLH